MRCPKIYKISLPFLTGQQTHTVFFSNDLSTYLVPSLYCVSFLSLFFQIIIILPKITINPRLWDLARSLARSLTHSLTKPSTTTILPFAHSGRRILSCPAPSIHLSVHLSIHSALVTTPQPTIFHGSYSYLAQLLTLVWLKIYEYTDWLASWCRPAKRFPLPRPLYFIVYISFHFTLLN